MFALILTVLAFSVDWAAAWSDYVKPGTAKTDDGALSYYDKAFGCHKGYKHEQKDGKDLCTKCDKLSKDLTWVNIYTLSTAACKDYKGDDKDAYDLHCYCKDKKWNAGSCPAQQKAIDAIYKADKTTKEAREKYVKDHKKYAAYEEKQCLFEGCMPYKSKARCSGMAVWAFILIIVLAFLVVVAIVVVVIIIILKLKSKPATKVDPTPAAESKAVEAPPEVVGPSVLIKLGKQEIRTKKTADGPEAVWGEAVVFTGLGAEDDDVIIEVNGNDGEVLGTAEQRIPEYVNNKKRAVLTLKNGEADAGVLEVDIEIQVQEEPEVKITGVFFVDKYTKPVPV